MSQFRLQRCIHNTENTCSWPSKISHCLYRLKARSLWKHRKHAHLFVYCHLWKHWVQDRRRLRCPSMARAESIVQQRVWGGWGKLTKHGCPELSKRGQRRGAEWMLKVGCFRLTIEVVRCLASLPLTLHPLPQVPQSQAAMPCGWHHLGSLAGQLP